MELLHQLIDFIRNPGDIARVGGYPVLALIIFVETGAFAFFLPGDSLLVAAGLYAATGTLNIFVLNLLLIPMAILGDATSYFIGSKVGPRLFNRPESRFFKPAYIKAAQEFYERHGGKAIIMARFVPVIRTFVPVVAGVAQMPYRRFASFNIIGGASWILSMTVLGFGLGKTFPDIGKHVEKVLLLIIFVSVLPGLIEWYRQRNKKGATA
jgi:membrane-associated protein